MNHTYYAEYGNVLLRPLLLKDIESLRVWRNDKEATRFLRPLGHITPEMQKNWFESYLRNPKDFTFAIVETRELNRLVGSVSLYDLNGDRAEFGRIQIGDAQAHKRGIGRLATVMSLAIGFELMGLTEITACVHRQNIAAHSNDMRVGFKITGMQPSVVGGVEDVIKIDRQTLLSVNPYAADIRMGDDFGEK